ncbi:MAG: VWA domain-containing protein, partial [Desulfobacula sp.]|nr:VWA domain-containing protein [Desulfobacula sp.]
MKLRKMLILSTFCFVLLSLYPVTGFCSPSAPPMIPLAGINDIQDLHYTSEGTGFFICKTNQGLTQCEVWGKQWKFHKPWQDIEKGKTDLKLWLQETRVDLISQEDEVIYAHKKTGENQELYFRIDPANDGYSCEILEKITLLPGKSITASISTQHPTFIFYTIHDGRTMDRFDIDGSGFILDDQDNHLELDIGADMNVVTGKLTRNIHFSAYRDTRESTVWEIQDMPQFPGTYRWSFSLRAGDNPPPFNLSIKKGRVLPQLKNGDALGGLLVKNVPYGAATAIPEYDDETIYPGFSQASQVGDVTPSGEALFWLPPGMWSIHVNPVFEAEDVSLLKSHFIPVQPGKMTFVEWPKSLNDAFARGQSGKMKILSAKADQKKAVLNIAMLGTDRTRVVPDIKNIEVAEAGQKGTLVSVERIKTPADIVLLLDSSGSMRGQMKAALNATKKFLSGLPSNTRIQVVDFDTQPKPLKGNTPKQVLTSLKSVKANGATALYDSILLGLDMLLTADRPTLLVFTDGVDANHNDTGPGSAATQQEVIDAVSASRIPVFTIGFGAKSDVNTLSRIADMSGGEYYVALDEEKLTQVFEQINSNLGSQFRIEYERPKSAGASNRPVISIMVDNSGSMDSWPDACTGCDKRMEKTRQLLRKFIEDLPDDFLIQVSSFSGDVIVEQVLTAQKEAALRGIAQMEGRSTTNILASVNMSLKTLNTVPSNRRYLVYLADAALDVDDDEKEVFEATLGKIKDSNISTLFIGMVGEEDKHAFEHAAKKTNGKFIVSKNFDTLSNIFSDLSKEILGAAKESKKSILRVAMTHRGKDGENLIFSAAKEVEFPLKEKSNSIDVPEEVVWKQGDPLLPYDS